MMNRLRSEDMHQPKALVERFIWICFIRKDSFVLEKKLNSTNGNTECCITAERESKRDYNVLFFLH